MKLNEAINNVPDDVSHLPPIEQLAIYWTVLSILLKLIRIALRPKGKAVIDRILLWGKENL